MTHPTELERALLESWSSDLLAVYADHLQTRGDPRGGLIALDLAPRPDDRSWRQERRARLIEWVGAGLADHAGHLVQCGFIHELRDGHQPADLLDTPLGDVVRGYSTWSSPFSSDPRPDAVREALERLARRPRPWLTRLAVEYAGERPCDPSLGQELIAATPNLIELYALGNQLFDSFDHPALRYLYTARLYQQPAAEFPDNRAEVIGILDHGYTGNWLVDDEEDLSTFLELIEITPTCNDLYASYNDLVGPHDSIPALLVRFHEAGLVQLRGPTARLSIVGRSILHGDPPPRRPRPSRVPPTTIGQRKWVLWCESLSAKRPGAEPEFLIAGLLSEHTTFLLACLQNFAVDQSCYEAIRDFLAFLADVVDAGEWQNVPFEGDLAELDRALRILLGYHRLKDYHLSHFSHIGNDTRWSSLESLARFLHRVKYRGARVMFRVAWGF